MIVAEYPNSVNIADRTPKSIIYIAQKPNGYWQWHRQTPNGCLRTSQAQFATQGAALEAAADVANCSAARLKVSPWQQAYIIGYWLDKGARAFLAGLPYDNLVGAYVRRGWMQAAEAEAVRQEAAGKPGLDCDVAPSLTLEEALALQEAVVAQRIAANDAILGA